MWSKIFQKGDGTPVIGPQHAEPEWAGSLRHMLQIVSDSAEEGRKILHSLLAKRPHLDLLPDVKTSMDVVREQVEQIREKIMDGVSIVTTASRETERSIGRFTDGCK